MSKKNQDPLKNSIVELETKVAKQSAILESFKPEKMLSYDTAIATLSAQIESVQKLQEEIIEEFKDMKEKVSHFNYDKVSKLDNDMTDKLVEMEAQNRVNQMSSKKIEQMFMDFQKNYIEFKEFKALIKQVKKYFEVNTEAYAGLRENYKALAKLDEFNLLKEKVKEMEKTMKEMREK